MITDRFDWSQVLFDATTLCERSNDVKLCIDRDIVKEISEKANASLAALNMQTIPNVAKVAGHVAFWIRKLKPIYHAADTPNKLLTCNEVIGILVGIGICQRYFDDHSKQGIHLSSRVAKDWAASLRTHSHSPHSCAIAFEFFATSDS
jgi:hypothetical protein